MYDQMEGKFISHTISRQACYLLPLSLEFARTYKQTFILSMLLVIDLIAQVTKVKFFSFAPCPPPPLFRITRTDTNTNCSTSSFIKRHSMNRNKTLSWNVKTIASKQTIDIRSDQ
jgi:hypothetical protein